MSEQENQQQGTPLPEPNVPEWGNEAVIIEPGQEAPTEEPVKTEVEKADKKDDTPEVETPATPAEPTPEDPGEFTPPDLSFEVTIFDADGNKPKTQTIKSVEQWDELLEKEPNFGTGAALMRAQRQATKMEQGLERAQEEHSRKKQTFDDYKKKAQQNAEVLESYAAEINYLVERGDIPEVAPEFADADWNDPEVAKQPGVKEQVELIKYKAKEDAKRIKAGLRAGGSMIDAFNAMQLDKERKAAKEAQKRSQEARKEAGARVAGASPQPVSVSPKGIAVGDPSKLKGLGTW